MLPETNLLVRLHHWATRQDENFTTEAFAHLLQCLRIGERAVAADLLRWLSKGAIKLSSDAVRCVSIRTQGTIEGERPDLEIRTSRMLAFIEAKVESGVGRDQLPRYRAQLAQQMKQKGYAHAVLILLTRYPVGTDEGVKAGDVCVRWFQVADWLGKRIATQSLRDPICRHTAEQFVDFLRQKGMTMEHVNEELVQGVRALHYFIDLLREAIRANKIPMTPVRYAATSIWFCLYGNKYMVGLSFANPGELWLQTYRVQIDEKSARQVRAGQIYDNKDALGKRSWVMTLDLNAKDTELESRRFFDLDWKNQQRCLERFIRDFMRKTQQVEMRKVATTPPD
jgi:hypothetical protein